jgi:hypothetical protein
MLRRLFGRRELTAEAKLAAFLDKRIGEPIQRSNWDHLCPVCGWPWTPTWHYRNDDRHTLWSSCEACFAVAIDLIARERETGQRVSMVTFIVAERELAEWMIAEVGAWPAYEIGEEQRLYQNEEYAGFRRRDGWEEKCPACRARWRPAWWLDEDGAPGVASYCHTCASVVAVAMLVRNPVTFDLEERVGFRIDEPAEDDDGTRIVADGIPPGAWSGQCPACDQAMPDPLQASTDEYGDKVAWCTACGAWAELPDGAHEITVWTTVHWDALASA